MTDDFWPGDHRAGDHFTQETFREAMTAVEVAWLDVLVHQGVAPADARADLFGIVEPYHEEYLVEETEAGGNPVIGLVTLLRSALEDSQPVAAQWLHRGLTSQDVLDTALMLMAQDAVAQLQSEIRGQAERLAALAIAHRGTVMVARTLTQHAVPTTFGLKAAQWLTGILDAYDGLEALTFPVQVGGAAGTRAALVELGADPAVVLADLRERLGLVDAAPWHTVRTAVTRLGDALVACTDAWGHLAADVLTLSRPEIGELSESTGGGSSTMPDKHNPVLSVLVRRAALTTPQLAATLHLAAALQVDERADGAWHAEWATLRDLVRRTLVAASHTFDLVAELDVHADRMTQTLGSARGTVLAEQRRMAELAGHPPTAAYLGEAGAFVDAVLDRARRTFEEQA
jgi:3-carboxy-cis,cis-muconate cycloisomerase